MSSFENYLNFEVETILERINIISFKPLNNFRPVNSKTVIANIVKANILFHLLL